MTNIRVTAPAKRLDATRIPNVPIATLIPLALLGLCAPVALYRALRQARGTTLVAPLVWAALAAIAVLVVKSLVLLAGGASHDHAKWELLAYASTFCPAIAMLGAKRPQNRAWQLIVLAMWFVVVWPAIQSLVVRPGELLELHPLWQWFCIILALLWVGIQAASRFFWIALSFSLGQLLLLAPHLPFTLPTIDAISLDSLGLIFLSLAALQAALHPLLTPRWKSTVQVVHGWNRVWLDFRDYFGLIWWRPVMDRLNAVAKAGNVPVYLDWHGFCSAQAPPGQSAPTSHTVSPGESDPSDKLVPSDQIESHTSQGPPAPEEMAKLDAALRNLLRRFVSHRWIDERL